MIAADAPQIWLPPALELAKPAIIRPAEHALLKPGAFRPMTREERRATIAELVRAKRLTFEEAKKALFFTPVVMWPANKSVVTTFAGGATSSSGTSNPSLSIGALLTTGHRIVGIIGRGSATRTISSVTVDGAAATALTSAVNNSNNTAVFYIAPATGNTTGTVALSLSGAWTSYTFAVWNVLNLKSTSPSDTVGTSTTYTSNAISASINVLAGGAAYALAYDVHNNGPTFTWSGLTEAFDVSQAGATGASGANSDFAATQTGLTVKAQSASGATGGVFVAVPMR
jgi:hypothetical protein